METEKCKKCGRENCRNPGGYDCQMVESGNAVSERPALLEKLAAVTAERDRLIKFAAGLDDWNDKLTAERDRLRGLLEGVLVYLETLKLVLDVDECHEKVITEIRAALEVKP